MHTGILHCISYILIKGLNFFLQLFAYRFRESIVSPNVRIEKGKIGNSLAPVAKVLARMSALKVLHQNEVAMLRAELNKYKNECKRLQQELEVYQGKA